jgi:hypothetical protein
MEFPGLSGAPARTGGRQLSRRSLLDWLRAVTSPAAGLFATWTAHNENPPRGRPPLRQRLSFRADSLSGLIHAALGLIGGGQLARPGVTLLRGVLR